MQPQAAQSLKYIIIILPLTRGIFNSKNADFTEYFHLHHNPATQRQTTRALCLCQQDLLLFSYIIGRGGVPKILFVGLVKGRIIGKAAILASFKGRRALVQKLVGINKAFGGNVAPNRGIGGLFNNAVQLIFT